MVRKLEDTGAIRFPAADEGPEVGQSGNRVETEVCCPPYTSGFRFTRVFVYDDRLLFAGQQRVLHDSSALPRTS